MNIFGSIEKLITEHGSAVILRERIGLAAHQYAALERENVALKKLLSDLEAKNRLLEEQARTFSSSNPKAYSCDSCGSTDLRRTGNRSDPTFGIVGVKMEVFSCNSCGEESAFTP